MEPKITPVTIFVTEEHIKTGIPTSCGECPVALAIVDATGKSCQVGTTHVAFDGVSGAYSLPQEAVDFIRTFDEAIYPVKPFSFELGEAIR